MRSARLLDGVLGGVILATLVGATATQLGAAAFVEDPRSGEILQAAAVSRGP